MATKIRLQLHGRKGYAFFPIVIADSRAPRDGRFIERIGSYNPNTNPATISLDFDRALYWIEQGAQPTDTARNILAQRRFDAWKADREKTAAGKRAKVEAKANEIAEARRKHEADVNKTREEGIAKKRAEKLAAEEAAAKAALEAENAAAEAEKSAEEA